MPKPRRAPALPTAPPPRSPVSAVRLHPAVLALVHARGARVVDVRVLAVDRAGVAVDVLIP